MNKVVTAFQLIKYVFLDTLRNTGTMEIPQHLTSAKAAYAKSCLSRTNLKHK